MRRLRPHLTYANVTATVALLAAIGGGTTAIAISEKAPKNSVVAKSIKKGNVTASKFAGVRVDSAVGPGASGGVTLRCQPQERLLTGGAAARTATGVDDRLSASEPTLDGDGWTARSNFGNVTVFVVCLKATPGK
jgi:hypothetical protein